MFDNRTMTDQKLTAKEQVFIDEYLIDLNAAQAAIRAGYAKSTAEKKAPAWVAKSRQNSTKPQIWDAVNIAKQKRSKETKINAEWVLKQSVALHELALKREELSVAKSALDLVGKHVGVKAFEQSKSETHIHMHNDLTDKLVAGRARASAKSDTKQTH